MSRRGLTLPEVLVSIAMIGLMLGAVVSLSMQATRIYAKYSTKLGPEGSQTNALKMMEREFHEAMALTRSDPTWVTLSLPLKDTNHLNVVSNDADTGAMTISPDTAHPVHYFLGAPGTAAPNASGSVLYRAVGSPTGGVYPHAMTLATGLTATPMVRGTNGTYTPTTLFAYAMGGRAVIVTLTHVLTETSLKGRHTVYHTSTTEFLLRNETGGSS